MDLRDISLAGFVYRNWLFVVYRDGKRWGNQESNFANGNDLLRRYDADGQQDGHIYSIMTYPEAREYETGKA